MRAAAEAGEAGCSLRRSPVFVPKAKRTCQRRVTGSDLCLEKMVGRIRAVVGQGLWQLFRESIKVTATSCP